MTSVWRRDYTIQKNQNFKVFTNFSSHKSENKDYEDLLGLNKLGSYKALILIKSPQVLSPKVSKIDIV